MLDSFLQTADTWAHQRPFDVTLLVLVLLVLWYIARLADSFRVLSNEILSRIAPDVDVRLARSSVRGQQLSTTVSIRVRHNPAALLGGSFRIYDGDDELLFKMPLPRIRRRLVEPREDFQVPVVIRLSLDERGEPKVYYCRGELVYADARSLAHYRLTFDDLRGRQVKRVGRLRAIWARLRSPESAPMTQMNESRAS